MDSIKVGPIRYEVCECSELKGKDGVDLYGEIDYVACQIRICTEPSEEHRLPTYWHEALHAILTHATMHKQSGNEQLIAILANGIVQVLQDNPEMGKVANG